MSKTTEESSHFHTVGSDGEEESSEFEGETARSAVVVEIISSVSSEMSGDGGGGGSRARPMIATTSASPTAAAAQPLPPHSSLGMTRLDASLTLDATYLTAPPTRQRSNTDTSVWSSDAALTDEDSVSSYSSYQLGNGDLDGGGSGGLSPHRAAAPLATVAPLSPISVNGGPAHLDMPSVSELSTSGEHGSPESRVNRHGLAERLPSSQLSDSPPPSPRTRTRPAKRRSGVNLASNARLTGVTSATAKHGLYTLGNASASSGLGNGVSGGVGEVEIGYVDYGDVHSDGGGDGERELSVPDVSMPSFSDMINPFTLHFLDPSLTPQTTYCCDDLPWTYSELEDKFRRGYTARLVQFSRVSFGLAAALLLLYALSIIATASQYPRPVHAAAYPLLGTIGAVICCLLTWHEQFPRYMQTIFAVATVFGFICVLGAMYNMELYTHGLALLVLLEGVQAATPLYFHNSAPICILISVVFQLFLRGSPIPMGLKFMVGASLHVGNVMMLIVAYMAQRTIRRNFYSTHTMEERNELVAEEKGRQSHLVNNILPEIVAAKLLSRMTHAKESGEIVAEPICERFDNVAILFADVVGFTVLSQSITPERLVTLLNDLFMRFDTVAAGNNVEKIKTIGDCYMCACGFLGRDGYDAGLSPSEQMAEMALDMLDTIADFNGDNGTSFQMRIGIHTGAVVAGVVGVKRFSYDLFGRDVGVAARMEEASAPGAVLVSESTAAQVARTYVTVFNKTLEFKDGELVVDTHWLVDKREEPVGPIQPLRMATPALGAGSSSAPQLGSVAESWEDEPSTPTASAVASTGLAASILGVSAASLGGFGAGVGGGGGTERRGSGSRRRGGGASPGRNARRTPPSARSEDETDGGISDRARGAAERRLQQRLREEAAGYGTSGYGSASDSARLTPPSTPPPTKRGSLKGRRKQMASSLLRRSSNASGTGSSPALIMKRAQKDMETPAARRVRSHSDRVLSSTKRRRMQSFVAEVEASGGGTAGGFEGIAANLGIDGNANTKKRWSKGSSLSDKEEGVVAEELVNEAKETMDKTCGCFWRFTDESSERAYNLYLSEVMFSRFLLSTCVGALLETAFFAGDVISPHGFWELRPLIVVGAIGCTVATAFGVRLNEYHVLSESVLFYEVLISLQLAAMVTVHCLWVSAHTNAVEGFAPPYAVIILIYALMFGCLRMRTAFVFPVCVIVTLNVYYSLVGLSPYLVDIQAHFLPIFFLGLMATYNAERGARLDFQLTAVLDSRAQDLLDEVSMSEELLQSILPESVLRRIRRDPSAFAERYDNVTILFCKLNWYLDSTDLSTIHPTTIVNLLNIIFVSFDEICQRHGVEKIKTIGGGFMAAAGVPDVVEDHALRVCAASLEMMAAVEGLRDALEKSGTLSSIRLSVKIGINSGPVVAGVIGSTKTAFDVFGDTVNTAARMESHSEVGNIQMSESTANQIHQTGLQFLQRGVIQVKGKGPMQTYYLVGPPASPLLALSKSSVSALSALVQCAPVNNQQLDESRRVSLWI